eukprot:Opistho-1_new@102579
MAPIPVWHCYVHAPAEPPIRRSLLDTTAVALADEALASALRERAEHLRRQNASVDRHLGEARQQLVGVGHVERNVVNLGDDAVKPHTHLLRRDEDAVGKRAEQARNRLERLVLAALEGNVERLVRDLVVEVGHLELPDAALGLGEVGGVDKLLDEQNDALFQLAHGTTAAAHAPDRVQPDKTVGHVEHDFGAAEGLRRNRAEGTRRSGYARRNVRRREAVVGHCAREEATEQRSGIRGVQAGILDAVQQLIERALDVGDGDKAVRGKVCDEVRRELSVRILALHRHGNADAHGLRRGKVRVELVDQLADLT